MASETRIAQTPRVRGGEEGGNLGQVEVVHSQKRHVLPSRMRFLPFFNWPDQYCS